MKKIILAASCMLALFMSSCATEERAEQPVPSASSSRSCDFNGNVYDGLAFCNIVNYVANCSMMDCGSGNYVTTTITSGFLLNQYNYPFSFVSGAAVTPAQQLEVLQSGQNYANANIPTGYFVSYINFQYSVVVNNPPPSYYLIYVTVTYKKCTGGGGGQG